MNKGAKTGSLSAILEKGRRRQVAKIKAGVGLCGWAGFEGSDACAS
jgi:hypothetical protein